MTQQQEIKTGRMDIDGDIFIVSSEIPQLGDYYISPRRLVAKREDVDDSKYAHCTKILASTLPLEGVGSIDIKE